MSSDVPDSLPDDAQLTPMEWANDVLWASKRIHLSRLDGKTKGRPPKQAPPGVSANRYAWWQFGRENQKEFMTNTVNRAIEIVRKSTARDEDEELIHEEEVEVDKHRAILKAALIEAQFEG